jgi:hypothetical protein
MMCSKHLIRAQISEQLHKANEAECKELENRMLSEECFTAISEFFNKRSKM